MLTIRTVLKFLYFDAQAIRTVATHRGSLLVGFLFVIAAGFAREYDGEYLLGEPWHLALPLAASLIGCFFMATFIYLAALFNGEQKAGPVKTFLTFLACYWMTAPMALLYGIPFERFLSPGDATRANLTLLAIVATWRVLLMIRCVNVLYENRKWHAILPVALFSDTLAIVALAYTPGPIIMIMGGVRLSESESLIQTTRIFMQVFGYVSLPVWVVGYLVLLFKPTKPENRWKLFSPTENEQSPAEKRTGADKKLLFLAIASIVFWIPFLFVTQPEQARRWRAENLIKTHNGKELARLSSSPEWGKFPPHWDMPPRISYGDQTPKAYLVLTELVEHGAAKSLIETFVEKTEQQLEVSHRMTDEITDLELERLLATVKKVEGGSRIAAIVSWTVQAKPDSKREQLVKEFEKFSKQKRQQEELPSAP